MPGDPTAFMGATVTAGPGPVQAAVQPSRGGGHWGFVFWLVLLGVLIPAAILGGLSIGGFSFVFKHR